MSKAKVPQNTYAKTHQEEEKEERGGNSLTERKKDWNHLNQIRLKPLNGELDNRNSRPNSSINVVYGIGQDSI